MTTPIPSSALQIEARCRTNRFYAKAIDASPASAKRSSYATRRRNGSGRSCSRRSVWPAEPTRDRDIDKYLERIRRSSPKKSGPASSKPQPSTRSSAAPNEK